MKTKISKFTIYLFAPLAILAIAGLNAGQTIQAAETEKQRELLAYAETIAVVADLPDKAELLPRQAKDISDQNYQDLKRLFYYVGNYGDNIARIYLIGINDNSLYYLLDSSPGKYSDNPFSENLAQPGQNYLNLGDSPWKAINSHKSQLSNYYHTDNGWYLTAFVPIIDPDTKVIAVLGVDRLIEHYYLKNYSTILPHIVICLGVLIAYLAIMRRNKKKPAEADFIVRYGK